MEVLSKSCIDAIKQEALNNKGKVIDVKEAVKRRGISCFNPHCYVADAIEELKKEGHKVIKASKGQKWYVAEDEDTVVTNEEKFAQEIGVQDTVEKVLEETEANVTLGTETPVLEDDAVNHPKHYTSHPSGIECIQIVEHFDFCTGNSIKYLWRSGLKGSNALEDLKKAKWYIERRIKILEDN